jgi:polyhydroxybutyrate depolymerase
MRAVLSITLALAAVGAGCRGRVGATLIRARPYQTHAGIDEAEPAPLLVSLHGYGGDAAGFVEWFSMRAIADSLKARLVFADGTLDAEGRRFWNAGKACCNFYGAAVDDVAYLDALLDDAERRFRVDRKRVYLVGFSNGGFMARRYACERPERVAAVVSIGGAGPSPEECKPKRGVSVLEIHADTDPVVPYAGGLLGGSLPKSAPCPSARDSILAVARADGCDGAAVEDAHRLDLDEALPGEETSVLRFPGCKDGASAELWTIRGGGHIPNPTPAFPRSIAAFLSTRARP